MSTGARAPVGPRVEPPLLENAASSNTGGRAVSPLQTGFFFFLNGHCTNVSSTLTKSVDVRMRNYLNFKLAQSYLNQVWCQKLFGLAS